MNMAKREDLHGVVRGRFEKIKFSRQGMRVTLSHPYWYFWAVIPGMSRTGKRKEGRTFFLPNIFNFHEFVTMLKELPLIEERYQFDFDITYTFLSATPQHRAKDGSAGHQGTPIGSNNRVPITGAYKYAIEVPKRGAISARV